MSSLNCPVDAKFDTNTSQISKEQILQKSTTSNNSVGRKVYQYLIEKISGKPWATIKTEPFMEII